MANFTPLYRKRGAYIAIVRFNADGSHSPVNDTSMNWPTKATWTKLNVPLIPGHIYAALQSFVDLHSATNEYHVLRVVDLTEKGFTLGDAKDRSYLIWDQARNSSLKAVDDPRFLLEAYSLGLLTPEEYQAGIKPPVVPVTTPTKKSTLVF